MCPLSKDGDPNIAKGHNQLELLVDPEVHGKHARHEDMRRVGYFRIMQQLRIISSHVGVRKMTIAASVQCRRAYIPHSQNGIYHNPSRALLAYTGVRRI